MPKTPKSADQNPPAENAGDPKKRKRKKVEEKGYTIYIHKVLKKTANGKTISAKAVELVNMLISDMEERLSERACELARFQKKSTLAAPHIQTATKLIFPAEMSGQAIVVASKALESFTA